MRLSAALSYGRLISGARVYALFLRDRLVYVGVSTNTRKRILAHKTNGRDFDYAIVLPASDDPYRDERDFIFALRPVGNTYMSNCLSGRNRADIIERWDAALTVREGDGQ